MTEDFEYWYKWKPVHYRRKTRHLTAEQDGIYRRLIDEYMETREALPDNEIALASIARISLENWKMASAIVLPFFRQKSGKLYHDTCEDILKEQEEKSITKSENGRAGAEKRWGKKKKSKDKDNNSDSHSEPISNTNSNPLGNQWQKDGREEKRREETKQQQRGGEVSGPPARDPVTGAARSPAAAEIVRIFDEERIKRFPPRACWRKSDPAHAQAFLDAGADVEFCREVFAAKMREMPDAPGGLDYFVPIIAEALEQRRTAITAAPKPLPERVTLEDLGGDTPQNREFLIILGDMRHHFGVDVFRSWLRELRVVHKNCSVLSLSAPTRFNAEWIRNRYAIQIAEIVRQTWSEITSIEIVSTGEKTNASN